MLIVKRFITYGLILITFCLLSYLEMETLGLVEKVESLCNEQKISIAALERMTGLSNGAVRRWRNSTPNTESVRIVADYFGVSVDWLLGRSQIREKSDDLELGVSAHKEGEDWTPEELNEIEQFKEFVRSKRNQQG